MVNRWQWVPRVVHEDQMDELATIDLIFIVNGEDVLVTLSELAPLSAARALALKTSHNTGRPATEWEIRDEAGRLLDGSDTVFKLGLESNTRMFLTLAVGCGGTRAYYYQISRWKSRCEHKDSTTDLDDAGVVWLTCPLCGPLAMMSLTCFNYMREEETCG